MSAGTSSLAILHEKAAVVRQLKEQRLTQLRTTRVNIGPNALGQSQISKALPQSEPGPREGGFCVQD